MKNQFSGKTNCTLMTEAADRLLELSRRGGEPYQVYLSQPDARCAEGTPREFLMGIFSIEEQIKEGIEAMKKGANSRE
jgi:hypothetical protein